MFDWGEEVIIVGASYDENKYLIGKKGRIITREIQSARKFNCLPESGRYVLFFKEDELTKEELNEMRGYEINGETIYVPAVTHLEKDLIHVDKRIMIKYDLLRGDTNV